MFRFLFIFALVHSAFLFADTEIINKDISKSIGELEINRMNRVSVSKVGDSWVLDLEARVVTNGSDGHHLAKNFDEVILVADFGYANLDIATPITLSLVNPIEHKDGILRTKSRLVMTSAVSFLVTMKILLPTIQKDGTQILRFITKPSYAAPSLVVELQWNPKDQTWEVIYGPIKPAPSVHLITPQPVKSFAVENLGFTMSSLSLEKITVQPDALSLPGKKPYDLNYFAVKGSLVNQTCPDAVAFTKVGTNKAFQFQENNSKFAALWTNQKSDVLNPFGVGCQSEGNPTEVQLNYAYPFEQSLNSDLKMASSTLFAFPTNAKTEGTYSLTASTDKAGVWSIWPGSDQLRPYVRPLPWRQTK